MKYRLFLMMATFVGLGSINTSCSRDNEPVVSDGDQKTPISFNVNVGTLPAPQITTRGELDDKTTGKGYYFNTDDKICIAIKGVSGSSRDKTTEDVKTYKVLAANAGSTHAAPAKTTLTYDGTATDGFLWLSTTEKIALRAWSNGTTTAAADPLAKDASSVTIPYELEKDQATNGYKELLYYSNSSIDYNASGIDIPLYHQLSRIVVTITLEDATAGTPSVTIGHDSDGNRVPVKGTFAESTTNYGSWTVASYATTTATHWDVVTPRVESTSPRVYSAVIIPGTGADVYKEGMRFFNIALGTKTFAYKLPTGGQTFEAGKQYNYTITVGNQGITVTSNITNWTDAVNGTDFTHGDGLAVLKNIKLNPLWFVAEKNLASNTSFASDISSSGYFYTWSQAMTNFAASTTSYTAYTNVGITIDGEKWHLPVAHEWMSIFPVGATNVITLDSDNGGGGYYRTGSGAWGFNETTKAGVQDPSYWVTVSSTEAHAIRFLGTEYCSAWKYELLGGFSSSNYGYLRVSSTLIDKVENSKVSAAAWYTKNYNNVLWGNDYDNGAVQRVFYACGMNSSGNAVAADIEKGEAGRYWSTTVNSSYPSSAVSVYFLINSGQGTLVLNQNGGQAKGFPVRLFRDN